MGERQARPTDRRRANIIEAVRFMLSRNGWHVAANSNGSDAVQAVQDKAPDIVILDVMLPDRSGYDVLADLRADNAMRSLPVMVLTARGQQKDRDAALSLRATRFMGKPFANGGLLNAVHDIAGGQTR